MKIKFKQWSSLAKGELAATIVAALLAVIVCIWAVQTLRSKWQASKAWSSLSAGEGKETIAHLDAAIAADPGFTSAYEARAALLLEAHKFDAAEADYTHLTSASQEQAAAAGHLGLGMIKIERAAKKGPDNIPDAARKALVDFDEAVKLDPNSGDAYLGKATAYLWRKELVHAAEAIGMAFETRNFSHAALPHFYYCRGVLLAQATPAGNEMIAKVISALHLKLKITPAAVTQQARSDFDLAQKLAPNWPDPLLNRSLCTLMQMQAAPEQFDAKAYAAVAQSVRKVIQTLPKENRAALHGILGSRQCRAGEIDEALAEFSKAIRLEPDDPVHLINRAACHLLKAAAPKSRSSTSYRSARKDLETALKKKGLTARQRFEASLRIAAILMQKKNKLAAAAALKEAKDALPGLGDQKPSGRESAMLDIISGALLLEKGENKAAIEHLKQASKTFPDNAGLQRLTQRLSAPPAIGKIGFVGDADPSDMQPILRIAGVEIRSCAKMLSRANVSVTFNGEPGEWQFSGRDNILAAPSKSLLDGKVTCKVTITDSLGNTSSRSFDCNVDGQPPEVRDVTPPKDRVIPKRGTIYTVELHDTVSGVNLESISLTALARSTGAGGINRIGIITGGEYQYNMSKLKIKRGARIDGPTFKFMLQSSLKPGVVEFTIECKDMVEHAMQAKWQYRVK